MDGTELTGNLYDYAIGGILYYTGYYPEAGAAMSTIERYATADADARQQVADWFGGAGADQSEHAFWATVCHDTTTTAAQVRRDWLDPGPEVPAHGCDLAGQSLPLLALPRGGVAGHRQAHPAAADAAERSRPGDTV